MSAVVRSARREVPDLSPGVVASIDAAVGGLCACGCGAPLAADSPSAWFASERCQRRWQSGRPDRHVQQTGLGDVFAQFLAAIQPMASAMARLASQLAAYGPADTDRPPAVDAARFTPAQTQALETKRHRSTGPQPVARAPRRVDARGAR